MNRKLTDEQVIAMRASAHRLKSTRLTHWAALTGVAKPTILKAIRGDTFSHLPEPYSPKTESPNATEAQAQVLWNLRDSDPVTWGYEALAKHANDAWGFSYQGSNVRRLLIKHFGDPKPLDRKLLSRIKRRARMGEVIAFAPVAPKRAVGFFDLTTPEGRATATRRLLELRRAA